MILLFTVLLDPTTTKYIYYDSNYHVKKLFFGHSRKSKLQNINSPIKLIKHSYYYMMLQLQNDISSRNKGGSKEGLINKYNDEVKQIEGVSVKVVHDVSEEQSRDSSDDVLYPYGSHVLWWFCLHKSTPKLKL